jgi:CsoR family transcriptional regulator, copper-sensing transcriptional repressor
LLTNIPRRGISQDMTKITQASHVKRLNRIEGQVRGLSRMIEEDRYCIDIVTQISAVQAALARVEEQILREHIHHCVKHAMNSGSKADQDQKIEELMIVISRSKA